MRWDELFADLEGQLAHGADAEQRDLELEEERLRLGRLTLRDRVLAMARGGADVRLQLRDGESCELALDSAGRDWLAGRTRAGGGTRGIVVPLPAVVAVIPAGDQLAQGLRPAGESTSELAAGLGIAFVLRDLSRRRALVELRTLAGPVIGTIDRVARDHLDLGERDDAHAVARRVRLVPFDALVLVRVV